MSIPLPLGVRVYNNWGICLDAYVTNLIEDFSFRSVVPGGFASATIRLHNPVDVFGEMDINVYNNLGNLFNRVQICDLRTMEICWEGRIEDARRNPQGDGWELGCLGAMVVASDIQKPMFYIDGDINSWMVQPGASDTYFNYSQDEASRTLIAALKAATYPIDSIGSLAYLWQKAQQTDTKISRFDCSYRGGGSNINRGSFNMTAQVSESNGVNVTLVDTANCNVAQARRANVIITDFAGLNHQQVFLNANACTTQRTTTEGDVINNFIDPHVQVQRMDKNGNLLLTAASYPNDWVTVPQIVNDVLGRFLVSGWYGGGGNTPYPGQVRAADSYIDTSSAAKITNLTYYDGTTAADILNDLVQTVQPGAYWAIWESRYGATNQSGDSALVGFRFEWATWPKSWGYQATTEDGFDSQPTGDGVYNLMFYEYAVNYTENWTGVAHLHYMQVMWDAANSNALADGNVTRSIYVKREEHYDAPVTAFDDSLALLKTYGKTLNTGTITVSRPIYLFDSGSDSWEGCSRLLDPWMIRPGKLIRILDLAPRAQSHDFTYGTTVPPKELSGTIYRVVATEFNSSTGECKLELDTPTSWSVPTQIAATPSSHLTVKVKG